MHVDEVGSLFSCCESIEPIFGVDEVVLPALLDPGYVSFLILDPDYVFF